MYRLKEITLSGYGVYQDLTFKIPKGLTRISGRNRSGKTLIFSALPAVIYGADGVPKGGKAVVSGFDDETNFAASVFNHGKSDRYTLSIDGVDQQTDTIAKSREVISKFFRVSESVFNTTVMVSSKIPHPLSVGTGSSRLDWAHKTLAFSEVYDTYGDIVEREIKDMRDKVTTHKILLDELKDLDKEKPEKPKKPEGLVDTDAEKQAIEELQAKLDKLREQERLPKKPKYTVDEYEERLAKSRKKLKVLREKQEIYSTYKAKLSLYTEQKERFSERISKIEKLAEELGAPTNLRNDKLLAGAKKLLQKNESKLEEARQNNEAYSDQKELRRYKDKKTILPDLKTLPKEAKELDIKFQDAKSLEATVKKLTKLMNYYEAASEDMTGECKVCGKDLGEQGTKFIEKAQAIKNHINCLEYNFLVEKARRTKFVESVDLASLEERNEKLTKLIRLLDQVPSEMNKPKEVEFDEAEFEEAQERVSTLKSALATAREYYEIASSDSERLSPEALKAKIDKLEKAIRVKNKRLLDASDSRIQYETALSLWNRYKKQRETLVAKIDELKKYPKRMKVAMALRQAFGRDGLRVNRLSETLELFVANLNTCAPLIFDEPFKFDIEVGSRKCDVIAHRNNTKGNIFTLSASESRGWQLIAALAMLRILPNGHRFDTIILDELEANMDDRSRDRFINSYLPELMKTVPNVVVVTPLSEQEMFIPANNKFQVTKKNGVSKIERVTR